MIQWNFLRTNRAFIRLMSLLVTVYLNYLGDNAGIFLNPHKFPSSLPSIFGPDECYTVMTSILDACVKCAFQQASFVKRILDVFPIPKHKDKHFYKPIQCTIRKFFHKFLSFSSEYVYSGERYNDLHSTSSNARRFLECD